MVKKKENTTSIGFEDAIWRAADKLRGNLNTATLQRLMKSSRKAGALYQANTSSSAIAMSRLTSIPRCANYKRK